jgi:dolichol-phosphate mannosyltransferase
VILVLTVPAAVPVDLLMEEIKTVSIAAFALLLLLIQSPAIAILLSRLLKGPNRHPPLQPQAATLDLLGAVSVMVPTLNEARRIGPCLAGLSRQSYEVREILVVDSHSQDGTPELIKAARQQDPRFRLITDPPLPPGWVGRPWALHTGFLQSSPQSQWILGIDADTQPLPGLVASLLATAKTEQYDLISLSPQFVLKSLDELWLQPALLITLIYRFGPSGEMEASPERVMANGQCFLIRRSLLVKLGGYTSACCSFCDDVTLARYAAAQGAKVSFLDGAKLLKVRMYEGAAETWREWGRSLDLKDATSSAQKWGDLGFLLAVQGLPIPLILIFLVLGNSSPTVIASLGLNLGLVAIRIALMWAIAPSYDLQQAKASWAFWLSPLADPLAVLRIFLSSVQKPSQWRGRIYS